MPLLQIDNLSHWFGGLQAVQNFETRLEGGEMLGLIGPNGAGKTTIFNLVTGVYTADEGRILLRDHNLVGLRPHEITARGIGRTFQEIRLWEDMTVLDNVRIPFHYQLGYGLLDTFFRTPSLRNGEKDITHQALELLDIFDLRSYVDTRAKNLPYGEQRRVEIVRALALRPQVLLLDEPVAGMNPGEITEMMDLIQWIHREFNLTIWIIEHHMQVIMGICDWIQVLDFGAIIAEGTPEQIQSNARVIEAYLGEEGVVSVDAGREP